MLVFLLIWRNEFFVPLQCVPTSRREKRLHSLLYWYLVEIPMYCGGNVTFFDGILDLDIFIAGVAREN